MQMDVSDVTEYVTDSSRPPQDPAVAALCAPLAENEPCGPDLDLIGDSDYLNFIAQIEGILPTSFFSPDDGRPFDPSSIDITGQLAVVDNLLSRSRDLRLLSIRARIVVLNRDIARFTTTLAAIASLLEECWNEVHPRPAHDSDPSRANALGSLVLPTVVFPLQYTPLLEGRRTGTITYRAWMIAAGDVKPRDGEAPASTVSLNEAIATSDSGSLGALRDILALLTTSLDRIQASFDAHGHPLEIGPLRVLAGNMRLFIDPQTAIVDPSPSQPDEAAPQDRDSVRSSASGSIVSLHTAKQALVAIAEYYAVSEPSSPTLPLVRQAYVLIGKSFVEIVNVLVPSQVDKAAFQIGTDHVFDLPLSRLATAPPSISSVQEFAHISDGTSASADDTPFRVRTRSEALSLLDAVQRYFRHAEPSSPVPMLCERGRALAEKDFMNVLENVLPKAALKSLSDK